MAKKMGVPFGMLCAGVNINDITHKAFSTGIIQRPTEDDHMKQSLSDAINIQLPYNLERLLFYLTNENHNQVKTWYDQLEEEVSSSPSTTNGGCMDLKQTIEEPTTKDKDDNTDWLNKLQTEFRSARVTDDQLCTAMKRVLEDYNYWVDPHTGVAFSAAEQLGYLTTNSSDAMDSIKNDAVVALMATAAPCKFQKAVTTALGKEKWEEYEREHFPKRGKGLIEKKEIQPIEYQAEAGKTLEENQFVWESKTRELINQLLLG
ncbi:MAG: threonine synthase [Bacillariaceae sp.]|jgi:threonine synthase